METKDLIQKFIEKFKEKIKNTNQFSTKLLTDSAEELGLKYINTHGLPFNGSTYEIYREVEIQGHKFKETVGHFKYIYAIYGDDVYVRIYDDTCTGGSALNGSESAKYIYKCDMSSKRC